MNDDDEDFDYHRDSEILIDRLFEMHTERTKQEYKDTVPPSRRGRGLILHNKDKSNGR